MPTVQAGGISVLSVNTIEGCEGESTHSLERNEMRCPVGLANAILRLSPGTEAGIDPALD